MLFLDGRALCPLLLSLAVGCGGAMPEKVAAAPPPPPEAPMAAGEAVPSSPSATSVDLSSTVQGVTFGARAPGGSPSGGLAGKQAPPKQQPAPEPQPQVQGPQAVQKQQSIIIYSAQINMIVFEVEGSMKRIEELSRTIGGFLAKREDRTIVIRVPAERFDEALRAVEKLGEVQHRNIMAEDVTEEFRDLEVRLKASKAVQERLTQLLAKATKVEESIAIERELDRVTMDIDRIEGRMKFLRDRAAFSTLTITFQPKTSENVSKNGFQLPTPWLGDLGLGRLLKL